MWLLTSAFVNFTQPIWTLILLSLKRWGNLYLVVLNKDSVCLGMGGLGLGTGNPFHPLQVPLPAPYLHQASFLPTRGDTRYLCSLIPSHMLSDPWE